MKIYIDTDWAQVRPALSSERTLHDNEHRSFLSRMINMVIILERDSTPRRRDQKDSRSQDYLDLDLYASVLKVNVCPSETSVSTHKITRCHNPKDHSLNSRRYENLKAYMWNSETRNECPLQRQIVRVRVCMYVGWGGG